MRYEVGKIDCSCAV